MTKNQFTGTETEPHRNGIYSKYYIRTGYRNVYPARKRKQGDQVLTRPPCFLSDPDKHSDIRPGLPIFFSLPDKHSDIRHQHNICCILLLKILTFFKFLLNFYIIKGGVALRGVSRYRQNPFIFCV